MADITKRLFTDYLGNEIEYDNTSPIKWRLTVYVLVLRDGKILMTEPAFAKRWELPGGEILPDETLIQGAMRECWEETGYTFSATQLNPLHVGESFYFERSNATYYHAVIMVIEGSVSVEPDLAWKKPDAEIERVEWVDPAILTCNNTYSNQWTALRLAIESISKIQYGV